MRKLAGQIGMIAFGMTLLPAMAAPVLAEETAVTTGHRTQHGPESVSDLAESLMATVEKVRASALGSIIPDLKLEGRPSLHNAKIFKITDDSISFLHEDGVANLRATTDELPPELVKKYDLGANSLRNRLQTLREMLSASEPKKN